MSKPATRTAIHWALAITALATVALTAESLLTIALGGHAPGWASWVCSHSTPQSIQHLLPTGRLGAAFKTSQRTVIVHWPHLIPIPLAIATLIYLHRADARHTERQREEWHHGKAAMDYVRV